MTSETTRRIILNTIRQGGVQCTAVDCLHERDDGSRDIHPDSTRWQLNRAADGTIIGPQHYRCAQAARGKKGLEAQTNRFLHL